MNTAQSTPERRLAFEGTPNFRDLGGYVAADGRAVKWRRLFRSGQLSGLTHQDQRQFEALDIKLLIDFRRVQEAGSEPNALPLHSPPRVVSLPIDPGSAIGFLRRIESDDLADVDVAEFMRLINREFVLGQGESFRDMFANLLDQEEGGTLVHCAVGKDRTGFAAAMMLAALGVSEDAIMADYMLTGKYLNIDHEIVHLQKKYRWGGDTVRLRPVLEVQENYLGTAFETIAQHFTSLDHYLEEVLGLGEREKTVLRNRYLEPC